MGVKGTKAMYEIAKAKAFENGIREIYSVNTEDLICGYALLGKEIRQIFFLEGFTRDKTIENYLKIWTVSGLVIPARNGSYFFLVEDDGAISILKKKYQAEGITRVYAEAVAA